MSSTSAPQRVGALLAAILFLLSSVAVTLFVVFEANKDNSSQVPPEIAEQLKQQQEQQGCQIGQDDGEVKAVPETFKPEGDVTTLQTTDLKVGEGQEAKSGDCLYVKYHGTLATTGEKFDGNFDEATTLKFPVGQGSVIQGWDQGVVGMKVGGLRRLVIPSELAYGSQASETIPADSDLVFVVELVKIQNP